MALGVPGDKESSADRVDLRAFRSGVALAALLALVACKAEIDQADDLSDVGEVLTTNDGEKEYHEEGEEVDTGKEALLDPDKFKSQEAIIAEFEKRRQKVKPVLTDIDAENVGMRLEQILEEEIVGKMFPQIKRNEVKKTGFLTYSYEGKPLLKATMEADEIEVELFVPVLGYAHERLIMKLTEGGQPEVILHDGLCVDKEGGRVEFSFQKPGGLSAEDKRGDGWKEKDWQWLSFQQDDGSWVGIDVIYDLEGQIVGASYEVEVPLSAHDSKITIPGSNVAIALGKLRSEYERMNARADSKSKGIKRNEEVKKTFLLEQRPNEGTEVEMIAFWDNDANVYFVKRTVWKEGTSGAKWKFEDEEE